MISGYGYILNGVKFDMPFMEMINSVLPAIDEFIIVTDPRFNDGTIEKLNSIKNNKLKITIKEIDLDNPGVDGATKAYARSLCHGDYLLQMDADEVFRKQDLDKIIKITKNWKPEWSIIGTGVINWFNGNHFKLNSAGWTKERLSVNKPDITHGIPIRSRIMRGDKYYAKEDTDGAGYISSGNGNGIESDYILADKNNIVNDIKHNKNSVWIHHYSWYNIPRKWSMKPVWHYFWGVLYGKYRNLNDYKIDRDGNPADFWSDVDLRELRFYVDYIRHEMMENSIIKVKGIRHPSIMNDWLKRQMVYYPKTWRFGREFYYDGYAKYVGVQ